MKKLFFGLILFASMTTQRALAVDNTYNAVLYFKTTIPIDTFFAGDSFMVYYTMDPAQLHPEIKTDIVIRPNYFAHQDNPLAFQTSLYSDTTLGYQKHTDPLSSKYSLKLKIPDNAEPGTARLLHYIVNGSILEFYVKAKTATDVGYHTRAQVVSNRFFTLSGQELDAEPTGVCYIRMDIYEDGSYHSALFVRQ